MLGPHKFRGPSLVNQIELIAFNGAPIIMLISFLIGGIVAQQGVFQLSIRREDFVVDLVGILILRELGVLLTAIMLAGRSGTAYTAEIGSMKMREEIDALRVIGLDPIEVLMVPRILALVISLPILTFISDIFGLTGGALVALIYGDIDVDASSWPCCNRSSPGSTLWSASLRRHSWVYRRVDRGDRGSNGEGLGGIARTADHVFGGQGDLHGHCRRRPLRHVLRVDRVLRRLADHERTAAGRTDRRSERLRAAARRAARS